MSNDIFEEFRIGERSRAISRLVKKLGPEKWENTPIRKKNAKIVGEQKKQKKQERKEINVLNQELIAMHA